ncbi:MAG: hypothetical protein A3A24_00935 [Candidatus Buchananbacteria bacterium RIFCSPLOWO2_01_FULL_46_12]|uniref:Uncharacterized protein n=1 Tax=Candidatus Buchananbacteria bacterium RIFCSPLOWO2_01_FULL_46_12 TaxID=1797546 RepID=A0A1G1YN50_9BACT|nr:MAG: hypothetical protein A3A24_00935 [Candidatus Buchananbacteria bacterium RIFCSPLOWO2_01_FULL_46_12]
MFLTVHATAAIIVTQQVVNPWLAFLIGFLSHFVLDAIPHGDEDLFKHADGRIKMRVLIITALIDLLLALIWFNFLWQQEKITSLWPAVFAAFGSMLPDFLTGFYLITRSPWLKWIYHLNSHIVHRLIIKKPVPTAIGLTIQGLFFLVLILYLFL